MTTLLERCVLTFALARELFFEELERQELSTVEERALRRQAAHVVDSLHRGMLEELEATQHGRETVRSLEQRRSEIARNLLAGATPTDEQTADLGEYDVNGWHVALIGAGTDVAKLVRLIGAQLRCHVLPVSRNETACALLGAELKVAVANMMRIALERSRDMDFWLAAGESARGLAGMRITHQQAQAASLVARHEPGRLVRYADVAPEAAALRDEPLGDALIETYLAPLDEMAMDGEDARRTSQAALT